jgi:hypothetical protein
LIDERFSATAFEALADDPERARALLGELDAAIANEMNRHVETALHEIAEGLRALGHNLIQEQANRPDPYSRRFALHEPAGDTSEHEHRLRIHFDFETASGYLAHAFYEDDYD